MPSSACYTNIVDSNSEAKLTTLPPISMILDPFFLLKVKFPNESPEAADFYRHISDAPPPPPSNACKVSTCLPRGFGGWGIQWDSQFLDSGPNEEDKVHFLSFCYQNPFLNCAR